jgi:hypothetical protein
MLEWQIAGENRTAEAFSIIGSQTGFLHWVDKEWLAYRAKSIFAIEPSDGAQADESGWAAWNAFLVWTLPHIEFYRLLNSQFAHAIKQTAEVVLPKRIYEQPLYHLGEHLMALYGRGHSEFVGEPRPAHRLLRTAIPDIRRHAMGFVGRSVAQEDDLPGAVAERFAALWDFYWQNGGRADASGDPESLLFGLWFNSGHFPEGWSLDRLAEYVDVVPLPQPGDAIVRRLAELAPKHVAKALSILVKMVHGDENSWYTRAWIEPAMQILRLALAAGGEAAGEADDLIDHLGRRGFLQFGGLLSAAK